MRLIALIVVLTTLSFATPASAQPSDPDQIVVGGRSFWKVVIGGAAVAIGTTIAAKSSDSTTVTTGGVTSRSSSFSKSQLITGLSIAGVGGIVLWDGLRQREPSYPHTRIGVAVAPRHAAVFLQKTFQ